MPSRLTDIYTTLFAHFGPQHWWPGDTPIEITVGAILTQNTAWTNVERAIANLRDAGLLDFASLLALPTGELAQYIRPAGYYNLKAKRLHNLLAMVAARHADLDGFLSQDTESLRQALLAVNGIGPETADSIALYAAGKPLFVVDAYTHRILHRHGLAEEEADYHSLQERFMTELPPDPQLYNEYHALIVRLGKEYCRKSSPRCTGCPLEHL
ncbi:MAG: endonuclease III domain-containing protein [Thermodesulfobacteriota bacterium]